MPHSASAGSVEDLAASRRVSDRVIAVHHPGATPDLLQALARDRSAQVRREVATAGDGPALRMLAHDPDWRTRKRVAQNPLCPQDVLITLADDSHWSVRWEVPEAPGASSPRVQQRLAACADPVVRGLLAERDDLHAEVARALQLDAHRDVRHRLASFTRFEDTMRELLADPLPYVRQGLALNDRLPDPVAAALARDRSWTVRATLAQARSLPEHVYERLAQDRSEAVRDQLAASLATPSRWLQVLATDTSADVRHHATENLHRWGTY